MCKHKSTDVSLPPESILTLWGTWIGAGLFYSDQFDDVKLFIDGLIPGYIASMQHCNRTLNSKLLHRGLTVCETHYKTMPQSTKKLETSVCLVSQILDIIKKLALMKCVHTKCAHNMHKIFANFCNEI
jgi:hypothetical protein